MTNAMDELRRRIEGATPQAAEQAENEDRKGYRVENFAAPWFRYLKFTGTLRRIEQGRSESFGDFANFVFDNLADTTENPKYNASKDTLPDGVVEYKLPNPDKRIQRAWEPAILATESAQAIEPGVGSMWDLVGRRLTMALDIEFIVDRDGNPIKDNKGYDRETWYYKVVRIEAAKGEAKPDPANVAVMAASLYGLEDEAGKAPALLKWLTTSGIKDSPLQKLVMSGGFVAHCEAEGLLASAEGVFYDPTGNSN